MVGKRLGGGLFFLHFFLSGPAYETVGRPAGGGSRAGRRRGTAGGRRVRALRKV